jgi:hexosaminidase
VNIADPAAGRIVDDLLKEYAQLVPGPYFHLGADEYVALASANPEKTYPQLAAAARSKYGSKGRIRDLTTAWLNARAAALRPYHRTVRAWDDAFTTGGRVRPDKSLEVAYWTGREPHERDPQSYLREGRKLINYNDAFLYYVVGQPGKFRYPTGQAIYERWTPRVVRGTTSVPATYDRQILGGSFAVWGDRPDAQTEEQVADGIFLPLRATAQKLWDPRKPSLSWTDFTTLADRLGS